MSDSSAKGDKPQIELASDEDWKTRIKEEDARRDAEAAGTPASSTLSDDASDEDDEEPLDTSNLPAASLISLLQMLSSQSILALGLLPAPNGKTSVQLPLAKHFIDLLGILDVKCKGNLNADEQRFLDGTLHELRMAYLEISKKQK